ncbi:MAG: hypothetical protein WBA31_10185 [Candidatus Dormiibacterota bacterium]
MSRRRGVPALSTQPRGRRLIAGAGRYVRHLMTKDAGAGIWLGLAFSAYLLLEWLGIAVVGGPGGLERSAVFFLVEALAVSSALYALAGRPRRGSSWWGLPQVAIAATAVWLLFIGSAGLLAPVIGYSWVYLLVDLALQLLFGLVLFPLLILLPVALVAAPAAAGQTWLHLYAGLGWPKRLLWLLEFAVLTTVWPLLQSPIEDLALAVIPVAAWAALAVAAVNAAGWAVVGGRLVVSMRDAALAGTDLVASWPTGPGVPLRRRGYAVVAGVLVVGFLAVGPSLQERAVLSDSLSDLQASAVSGSIGLGQTSLQEGTQTLAEAYAAAGVAAAAEGHEGQGRQNLASALWWAPQDQVVARLRAWLDAMDVLHQRADLRVAVTALQEIDDPAGVDQAEGLVASQTHQGARGLFFAALAHDANVELLMPESGAANVPWVEPAEASTAKALIQGQRESYGQTLGTLEVQREYGATEATAAVIEDLMEGAAQPQLVPDFEQDYAVAAADLHLLNPQDAAVRLQLAFERAQTGLERSQAAAGLMYVSLDADVDAPPPVMRWISQHGDPTSRIAYGTLLLGRHEDGQALSQLDAALRLGPSSAVRSRAQTMIALLDYTTQRYQKARAVARLALADRDSRYRAMAEAVEGNSTLALASPASQVLGKAELEAAVHTNPYAFMTWYALRQIAIRQGDLAAAVQDDRSALVAYELVASQGLGSYAFVVNGGTGNLYSFAGGQELDTLTNDLTSDVAALHRGGS